ncbi:DUF4838 domain-containing protein [Allomuricauda sp. SCSIO 65647]|uniref:DUF4838 domain-containing protein n=1 Tax=Allomuricauda sp. SCSIO 65647 TaxID=2908843 RepID=UPI001F26B682|nr:DUF4838 domain-containing protein [Muricauda sp. SCSIO 65647]UJH67454.1 DUF4838 domain-containing protein [Muricauda sp. SCSIO 65647]
MFKNFLLGVFVMLLLQSCVQKTIQMAENGSTEYTIVIDKSLKNDATISKVAVELQKYFNEITGANLPIAHEEDFLAATPKIFLGLAQGKNMPEQKIALQTMGNDLMITGGSPIAVQNAVYEFLESHLGCRWYAPGAEEIPDIKKLKIPEIHYQYLPDITTRTVHSRLFYENADFADKHKVTHTAFPKYVPEARVHTFHRFLPEETFYEEFPEYYALRGDQRLPTQLCLTNETVLEIVKDSVAALLARNPEASVVSVSQDDNQQHCLCADCKKIDEEEGSPAGTMIHFVNKVAEAFPEKTISTLAYQYTRKPPKTAPRENVLVTLCSIECDRSAPIAEKCIDFSNDLKGWGTLTKNIRIWDYTTQFTNFLAPFPNLHTLQPNVQLFRNNNARWIFEQHSNHPSELFELRSYLTAKLLWNPDLDVDALIEEFTDGYYEQAGKYIRQYIDLIHSELEKDDAFFLFLYGDPSEAFTSFLSPELLNGYVQLFDQAEAAVADRPEIVNRVKMARMSIDYAVLEASRKGISDDYRLLVDENGKKKVNPILAPILDSFMATSQKNNITLMNEMGYTVAEYGANYLSALEVSKKPNIATGKKVISLTKPKKYANENPMVLTDGALGGSSFYANWLGYEGDDMEVIIDLGTPQTISTASLAFLQVTNHVVFFPTSVAYYGSNDKQEYTLLARLQNPNPLEKTSKVNDIHYFDAQFKPQNVRYVKIVAKNTETPYWHHAAGLPSWVFADEIILN